MSLSLTAAGRNAEPIWPAFAPLAEFRAFLASRPKSPLALSEGDKIDLCRAAKRAWRKLPARSDARYSIFAWRGERFFATRTLFGVVVRDAAWRRVAAMYWDG